MQPKMTEIDWNVWNWWNGFIEADFMGPFTKWNRAKTTTQIDSQCISMCVMPFHGQTIDECVHTRFLSRNRLFWLITHFIQRFKRAPNIAQTFTQPQSNRKQMLFYQSTFNDLFGQAICFFVSFFVAICVLRRHSIKWSPSLAYLRTKNRLKSVFQLFFNYFSLPFEARLASLTKMPLSFVVVCAKCMAICTHNVIIICSITNFCSPDNDNDNDDEQPFSYGNHFQMVLVIFVCAHLA